jgi:pyridoxal phosphate enzyme (YggS family)
MTIETALHSLQNMINKAAFLAHRSPDSVRLVAVSKQRSSQEISEAFHAGQQDFGENYLQEALEKINQLTALPICWHFIGSIQRNKTKAIATHFSWAHSITSILIADRLNEARPDQLPPLNVCIQLNLDNEITKAGVTLEDALTLAKHISTLPRLTLRGVMAIPSVELDPEKQYASFLRVTQCLYKMNQQLGLSMDTLSMGMSQDYPAAIRAGSTIIRIGTAIFGQRS